MSRLAEILNSRHRSLRAIERASKIPEARLQELMMGSQPKLSELRKLGAALGMPLSSFLAPPPAQDSPEFKFRRAATPAVAATGAALVEDLASRASGIFEILEHAQESVRDSFSWLGGPKPLGDPDELAAWVRSEVLGRDNIAPLTELPRLLSESLGVVVSVVRHADLDGASAIIEGIPVVFLSRRFKPRMLFTLAHELGHLLLHGGRDGDFARVELTTPAAADAAGQEETFANRFAAALLLPSQGLAISLKVIRESIGSKRQIGDIEIMYLARLYGVSFDVAANRCEVLTLLPRGGARALNDFVRKEFGSAEKKADQLGLPQRMDIEFPVLSSQLFRAASSGIDKGHLSIGRVVESLRIPVSDLLSANKAAVH